MKRKEYSFTGTPTELDELTKEKRKEGFMVKVKRLLDLDDGRRKYLLRLTSKLAVVK